MAKPQRIDLDGLARRLFAARPDHRLLLLRAAWPRAVGAELARRTRVLAAEGTTLRVAVPDAAWRRTLHGMRAEVLRRLRAALGDHAPARLAFQEQPFSAAEIPPAAPVVRPAFPLAMAACEPPDELRRGANVIADEELRLLFLACAARALARRRAVLESRCAKA